MCETCNDPNHVETYDPNNPEHVRMANEGRARMASAKAIVAMAQGELAPPQVAELGTSESKVLESAPPIIREWLNIKPGSVARMVDEAKQAPALRYGENV